ncbi:MAG: YggS family pyridoxal phosphate-dependent enzyme [Nitriliruptoraceae bacterium]
MSLLEAQQRLQQVTGRLDAACAAAGRQRADVLLIAVSKTHSPAAIKELIEVGLDNFGENRVQELQQKYSEVDGIHWHLIGQLQQNKARQAVAMASLIHGVDRRSLADRLSHEAVKQQVNCRALIQVNVDEDPRKAGCRMSEAHDLVAYATTLPNLTIEGLMTIPAAPPIDTDPNMAARPTFAALRQMRDTLVNDFPNVTHLSMGMSSDIEAAIAESATMVRVGTALFGVRGAQPWQKERP